MYDKKSGGTGYPRYMIRHSGVSLLPPCEEYQSKANGLNTQDTIDS